MDKTPNIWLKSDTNGGPTYIYSAEISMKYFAALDGGKGNQFCFSMATSAAVYTGVLISP